MLAKAMPPMSLPFAIPPALPFYGRRRQFQKTRPGMFGGGLADQSAKLENHGIGNGVINIEPLPATPDQPTLAEGLKVLGNVWLAAFERFDNFTHWTLTGLKQ